MDFDSETFELLSERYGDYISMVTRIYHLDTDDVDQFFAEIQGIIEKYHLSPHAVVEMIDSACQNNKRYLHGYWSLFNKVMDNYKIDLTEEWQFCDTMIALIVKQYKVNWNLSFNRHESKTIEEILEVYPKDSILYAILHDDIHRFKDIVMNESIDLNKPINSLQLIEWSALHGSLEIFRFLRSNGCEITNECFKQCFRCGNNEIIKECLQTQFQADDECMENAVIMCDLDCIIMLNSKYNLPIPDNYILSSFNLQAFLYKLCLDRPNYNNYLVKSIIFGIPSLVEFILERCPVPNKKNSALYAAIQYKNTEIAEMLRKHGAIPKNMEYKID